MRPARTRIGVRFRQSALVRHVKREWADPEVRSALKDVGVLYGLHKGLKTLPRLQHTVLAKFAPKEMGAMDVLREAQFGPRKAGMLLHLKKAGQKVRALRFSRGGLGKLAGLMRKGKSALRVFSRVRV